MKKLVVYLQGGLGNQLFQYYAGEFYAKVHNRRLVLNLTKIKSHQTARNFALREMQMSGTVEIVNHDHLLQRLNFLPVLDRLLLRFPILRSIGIRHKGYYIEKNFDFDYVLRHCTNLDYITGYFQTYEYFDSCGKAAPQLKEYSGWYEDLLAVMKRTKPVVIHFRGGDYFRYKDTFGVLHESYYKNGMELVSSMLGETDVYIFSDDLMAAQTSLSFLNPHRVTWVVPPAEATPFENLLLMSQGSAIIMSNSTFSWWAAKFAELETIIIAPQVWSKQNNQPQKLIPTEWFRVDNSWI